MNRLIVLLLIVLSFLSANAQSILDIGRKIGFSETMINATVLIEKKDANNNLIPHGTGFLLHNYAKPSFVLVTCAHVLKNKVIYIKIPVDNDIRQKLIKYKILTIPCQRMTYYLIEDYLLAEIKLVKDTSYVIDEKLDIGAIPITMCDIDMAKDSIIFKPFGIVKSCMKYKKDIALGDEVYFIGFPFCIGTEVGYKGLGIYSGNVEPLIRTGSIAWKSDKSNEFLLDAFCDSGNSGSPIIVKTSLSTEIPYLYGMTFGHLSTNENNLGLARCYYMDDIMKVVQKAEKLK